MKEPKPNPEDMKLSTLLRASRASPSLPPRFQEEVWRRIEESDALARPASGSGWLDSLATLVLRPRFAFTTAVMLIIAGALFGAQVGSQAARREAQERYITAVAPNVLR